MATNAGTKWTKEEDDELLNRMTDATTKAEDLATDFKRTIGSVQNRLMNLLYNMLMSDEKPSIDELCEKYNVLPVDLNKYIKYREDRTEKRREVRKETKKVAKPKSGPTTVSKVSENEIVPLLKDIRNYMKIIINKLEK